MLNARRTLLGGTVTKMRKGRVKDRVTQMFLNFFVDILRNKLMFEDARERSERVDGLAELRQIIVPAARELECTQHLVIDKQRRCVEHCFERLSRLIRVFALRSE